MLQIHFKNANTLNVPKGNTFFLFFNISVQVHDIFYPFLQTKDDEITFIWVNESKTGFCHLYRITSSLQPGSYQWSRDYSHSEGKGGGGGTGLLFLGSQAPGLGNTVF